MKFSPFINFKKQHTHVQVTLYVSKQKTTLKVMASNLTHVTVQGKFRNYLKFSTTQFIKVENKKTENASNCQLMWFTRGYRSKEVFRADAEMNNKTGLSCLVKREILDFRPRNPV